MLSIAIDMDETMADTTRKLQAAYFSQYGSYVSEEALLGKDFRKSIPVEHVPFLNKTLQSPGFFRDIPLFPDVVEVVKELNSRYEIYLVSAATEFRDSLKDKLEWMEEHFPFLTWRQLCLCGNKSLVQTDFMIDDRSRNFKNFKGKTYLYTAHHNVHETAYERVNNWKEVANRLL